MIPGFEFLKDAFNKFKDKYSGEDLKLRAARSIAAGGKAALDKAQGEFPQAFVKNLAADIYATISSQEIADGISTAVRSFDEEKVKDSLDAIVSQLKDSETSLKLAKQLKDVLNKASLDDLEGGIEAMLGDRSPMEKMMIQAFLMQIRPQLEEIRDGSPEDAANAIQGLAEQIPTDAIAAQVGALTRNVTPEAVSKQTHDFVGKLPSPGAVSSILHDVAKTAAQKFDDVSKAQTASEAKDILSGLGNDVRQIVSDKIEADNASKKSFGKKKGGGGFKL